MPTVASPDYEHSVTATGNFLERNPLAKYLWQYKHYYLVSLIATLIAAVISLLVTTYLVERAISYISEGRSISALGQLASLVIVAGLIQSVFGWSGRWFGSTASREIEYYLRADLTKHFLNLDQSFFLKTRTGDLMSRAMNDLQAIRDMIGPIASAMGRMIIVLIVGFLVLLTMNVRLAFFSLAYLPLIGLIIAFFEVRVEHRFNAVQEQLSILTDAAQESMSGVRAVKAYAREESEISAFASQNEEMRKRAMSLATYQAALWPVFVVLGMGTTLIALFFGTPAVINGELTSAQLVRFILVLGIISWDLMMIGWVISIMQLGLVANKRITELFRQPPSIENGDTNLENHNPTGNIKFRDVSVVFDEAVVLDKINLEIPLGQTVAIAGKTGSGKTTLVNLLPRMTDVTGGVVEIDGIDVRKYKLNVLREMIGFVPQEAYLFSDSLINNLEYGQSDPTPENVSTALNVSRLSKDLEQLDNKLETLIGERGASLSGGQKQRAALARTVLKNAPILVLDDSLSHVDTNTEEEILAELKTYMNGRTTLLIAHRTSTLRTADVIVMLRNGTIVELGPHNELVKANGPYAQLYKEQLAVEALGVDLDQLKLDTTIDGSETR